MMTTVKKNTKPVYEEVLDSFNRKISVIVKKTQDNVAEQRYKGQKSGEIDNLMKCDIFSFINWEITSAEREAVGVSDYEHTVEKPLSREFSNEEHNRIYDEITDSFIQGVGNMYTNSIVGGIITNYTEARKKNETTYADNIQKIKGFLDAKGTVAQNRFDGDAGAKSTMTKINKIKTVIESDIAAKEGEIRSKKKEIERLTSDIEVFEGIIYVSPEPSLDGVKYPIPEPTVGKDLLAVIGESFTSLAKPFIFLVDKLFEGFKGFTNWIGVHAREFTAFISKMATQPAFWITILFAVVNTFLFHRLFSYMFSDSSMVRMLMAMYISVFAILPFFASKHLSEYSDSSNDRATKALLGFDTVLILVAITYLIMAVKHRHIYADDRQIQIFAAIIIGLLPFLTSIVTGFINYRRLKNNPATYENQSGTAVNETETQPCEVETQPTEAKLVAKNNNDHEEIIYEGATQHE